MVRHPRKLIAAAGSLQRFANLQIFPSEHLNRVRAAICKSSVILRYSIASGVMRKVGTAGGAVNGAG